tara:strand:- start:25 stop:264 length:240 start_codon:yes stop_codon:yes gene_type:complete
MKLNEELLNKIIEIVSENLSNETIDINSSSSKISKWDSMSHIRIILSLEKQFSKIDNSILHELNSVKKIYDYFLNKKNN